MKKIYVIFLFLAVAFVLAPATSEAQEVTDPATLRQIAAQLEQVEEEVNRLTLLVTKLTLERQAADLQRQLAALMPAEEAVAVAPVAAQPASAKATAGGEPFSDEFFSSALDGGEAGLAGEQDDNRAAGFAAALGPLGNLGTPELAALIILAFLAVFVLLRRLSARKKSSLPHIPQAQQSLLDEGRQELKENVVWK